jgi:hypothetical protein
MTNNLDLTAAAAHAHISMLRDQAYDQRLAARAACLQGSTTVGDRLRSALRLGPRDC